MDKPIRILHVIGIMNRGGAEAMIMNLYRNIDRTKIQFDFVENSFEPAMYDEEIKQLGGKIYRCPHYNGKNHFTYKKWWERFWKEHHAEYQIVHGHIGSTAAIYLKVAKKYGKYTIAHSHSSGTDYSLKQMLYKIISYNTRNVADFFFACSEAAGRDRYGKKVVNRPQQYKVLNNAIDTRIFVYDEEERKHVRQELNCKENQLVIGHVGRFTSEKNHTFIIDVFAEVIKTNPDAKLLLVGDGPLRTSIEIRAEEIGVKHNVCFIGVRSDVSSLMQAMDVLLFPSIYEGLPVTLVEAQATGLPCLISDAIPTECEITEGLITVKELAVPVNEWATVVSGLKNEHRCSRCDEIKKRGYDILETAKWLEDFYVNKAEKKS